MESVSKTLTNLLVQSLVVWVVWRSYRKASFFLSQKYATFWPRFWTGTVDSLIFWPLEFLCSLLLLRQLSPPVVVLLSLLQNVLGIVYSVSMHARWGQTVGKMVCKVRVVDHLTEAQITVRQAILREVLPVLTSLGALGYMLYLIGTGTLTPEGTLHPGKTINWAVFAPLLGAPFLWFLVEVVTMLSNDKRRALHDFIAGTTVVRTHVVDV